MYYGDSGNIWVIIIGVLVGAIILFLICRELVCWYWKINKMVKLMEDQNEYLKKILVHFDVSLDVVDENKIMSTNDLIEKNDETNNVLRIKRLENVFGSAMPFDVNIDNQIKFALENGEEKIVTIQNGNHTISVTSETQHGEKKFEINNDEKIFYINIGPPMRINEA